jgi:hypothetical protein
LQALLYSILTLATYLYITLLLYASYKYIKII